MPKYVIPFKDKNKWESKDDCSLCSRIDKNYNEILNNDNISYKQKQINFLDRHLLISGYSLIELYERNGYGIYKKDKIIEVKQYKSESDIFYNKVEYYLNNKNYNDFNEVNIDKPVLMYSKWCKECGSRKPDIYDTEKRDNLPMLDIVNFYTKLQNNKVYITWKDIEAFSRYGTKLIKKQGSPPKNINDGEILIDYTNTVNRYSSFPFVDKDVVQGNLYYYKIYTYDKFNKIIKESNTQEVYVQTTDFSPPNAINDLQLEQDRKIEIIDDKYKIKDYLYINWSNPQNKDLNGVLLKMHDEYVPTKSDDYITINDYKNGENFEKIKIDVTNKSKNQLYVNKRYYFKLFPYDIIKKKKGNYQNTYEDYRNYNDNSIAQSIKLFPHVNKVKNISIKEKDHKLLLQWEDPNDDKWEYTKILIKENNKSLTKDDGELVQKVYQHNKYSNDYFVIDNLKNNVEYNVAIFPVNSAGICNVNLDNQIKGVPGYYTNGFNFDLNQDLRDYFEYLGAWELYQHNERGNVMKNPPLPPNSESMCYFELFKLKSDDLRYNGYFEFDYKITTIQENSFLNVYINEELIESFTCDNLFNPHEEWKKAKIKLPNKDYIKIQIKFETSNKNVDDYVMIDDLQIKYNSYEEE
jgi:hypothetical protein